MLSKTLGSAATEQLERCIWKIRQDYKDCFSSHQQSCFSEQKGSLNYSLPLELDIARYIYKIREKNNFCGIATVLCTSPGQSNPSIDSLALSSFSRKGNLVKTKVVKLLCEMYQFERVNIKVVRYLQKGRLE